MSSSSPAKQRLLRTSMPKHRPSPPPGSLEGGGAGPGAARSGGGPSRRWLRPQPTYWDPHRPAQADPVGASHGGKGTRGGRKTPAGDPEVARSVQGSRVPHWPLPCPQEPGKAPLQDWAGGHNLPPQAENETGGQAGRQAAQLLTESQENLVLLLLQVELVHLEEWLKLFAVDVVEDLLRTGREGGRGAFSVSGTLPLARGPGFKFRPGTELPPGGSWHSHTPSRHLGCRPRPYTRAQGTSGAPLKASRLS